VVITMFGFGLSVLDEYVRIRRVYVVTTSTFSKELYCTRSKYSTVEVVGKTAWIRLVQLIEEGTVPG
jgi:hypothetical protein